MIEIFEGRLGGGKSYTAVCRIVNQLAKGQVVVTNIECVREELAAFIEARWGLEMDQRQLITLSGEQLREFHRHVPWGSLRGGEGEKVRVLLVVDEAHLYFNARDWSQTDRTLLAYLTQSDKFSVDVIFISQSMLNIDKQFARLVQYIWRFRDMEKFKVPGLGIKWPMKQILQVQLDYDGRTVLNRNFEFKDKRIFKLYRTAALLTPFSAVEAPNNFELKKVKKKRKVTRMRIVLLVLFIGFTGWLLWGRVKNRFFPAAVSPVAVSAPARVSGPPVASPTATPDAVPEAVRFLGQSGDVLRTDAGTFEMDKGCVFGRCVGYSDGWLIVRRPSGKTAYIYVERYETNGRSGFGATGVSRVTNQTRSGQIPALASAIRPTPTPSLIR